MLTQWPFFFNLLLPAVEESYLAAMKPLYRRDQPARMKRLNPTNRYEYGLRCLWLPRNSEVSDQLIYEAWVSWLRYWSCEMNF